MKRPTAAQLSLVAMVAVLGAAIHLSIRLGALQQGIADVIEQHTKPPQSISQETTRASGNHATVVTVRSEGEGLTEFMSRHDDAVNFFHGRRP